MSQDIAAAAPDGDTLIAALNAAMAAEHVALWAYGLVTAFDPDAATDVTAFVGNHQALRNVVADLLVRAGAVPVSPEPAYDLPFEVTDPHSAQTLALTIESDCAGAWHGIIGATTDSDIRAEALSALTGCSIRMVTWRRYRGDTSLTEPFPGTTTITP